MSSYKHIPNRQPCPYLPTVDSVIRPSQLRKLKEGRDREAYFLATLRCAQSLWLCGFPAQALLQLNFSLSIDLPESSPILQVHPLPYRVKVWILENRSEPYFLGNPVRHYQHLATRMRGRHQELRTMRAWACFQLAGNVLPANAFPMDTDQLEEEQIEPPDFFTLLEHFDQQNRRDELSQLESLFLAVSS